MESEARKILMAGNRFVLVDASDYIWLNKWRWYPSPDYAYRQIQVDKKRSSILMHRLILNATNGQEVDHVNGDGLDNRRCNIRLCTPSQNQANRGKDKRNTSGRKGVTWNKCANKWQAQTSVNGKRKYIGIFSDVEKAHKAYNKFRISIFGEFHHA
jgi:hypothetical protein